MEKKTGIVILNYKAYKETQKCVSSIRNTIKTLHPIVIVDNGSGNGSYEYLKEYYDDRDGIYVIKSDQNLGFAKGNNIGIRYLRDFCHVDFVLLLNSDTLMEDERYIERLVDKYQEGVGIIEANVKNRRGNFAQPSLQETSAMAYFFLYLQAFCKYHDIYWPFKRRVKGKRYFYHVGCSIMLTPDYFKVYHGLYSYTFLYGEEHILLILLDRAGLRLVFADDTCIIHHEGRSTSYGMLEGSRKKEKKAIKGYWNAFVASCLPYKLLIKATE